MIPKWLNLNDFTIEAELEYQRYDGLLSGSELAAKETGRASRYELRREALERLEKGGAQYDRSLQQKIDTVILARRKD